MFSIETNNFHTKIEEIQPSKLHNVTQYLLTDVKLNVVLKHNTRAW